MGLLFLAILGTLFYLGVAVTINVNPSAKSISENDDSYQKLFDISCTSSYRCTCSMSGNLDLFEWGSNAVYKKRCTDTSCGTCPGCSSCSTSNGCLTGGNSYNIDVTCTGYNVSDSASATLTVTVTDESTILTIDLPSNVPADNSMRVNTILTTATKSSGPAILSYTKETSVENSYLLNTEDMFDYNTANGQIYVAQDPSLEYDFDYSMRVCIHSRRQNSCSTITINFDGCFQTPNCDNQTNNTFSDQLAIGVTLFKMKYTNPSEHFAVISDEWQNLRFSKIDSTLSVVSLDEITGIITTTGNVTVWPDYPKSTHSIVVEVSNTGHSCSYTARCTMSMQFSFTNWPISFRSLPASNTHHEDGDERALKHSIITYDGNDPEQDNVTCDVTANDEDGLLELYHNGNNSYDSWFIYKKKCQDTDCGYINENFLCAGSPADGCLNYDERTSYTITINCRDAYGSSTGDAIFTLNVLENKPPVFTNTPTTITLNTDLLAYGDKVFSIYYTDDEKETLQYNFTVAPTTAMFAFDSEGNYHNNPANVTSTTYQWDQVNSTFEVSFCGRERRNIVCSSFTIDIREYCGPTPECTDISLSKTDQFPVGDELFQIDVTGTGYTSLTYVIITQQSSLFTVDPTTGSVTSLAPLPVTSPPAPTNYSIVANVYDTAACDVAACTFIVSVSFTNFPISITNVDGVSDSIHEDTTEAVTLLTIGTSDSNTNDGVSCEVDDAGSTPANNNIFFAVETDTGSNVFELISKEGAGFDYGTTDTYIVVVICQDNYGSSATASMTVSILENQPPTIDNLNTGDEVNVDPMSVSPGYVIFTLQTTDAENDPLDYSCTVNNNFNPLQCLSDGVVSLRRKVRVPEEDGAVYEITLCINDTVHDHGACETLGVTFTSSKTNPVLNNLPDTVSFPENSTVSTELFIVTVEDPDIGDVYTYKMTVYPNSASSLFFLNINSGIVTLQGALDYETRNSYVFLFEVRDQYLPGLEGKYLTLDITDINEAPTLTLNQTTFNTIEQSVGYEVAKLTYTCTDVDAGQTMTMSIFSGTHAAYFSFDSISGVIAYAQDWDFEVEASLPQSTSLEIKCDDGNGLSDSVDLVINISPKNEFAPVLSLTEINVTIYNNQTLLDPLFVVTATDADFGDDGVFEFSIVGSGKGNRDFKINSAGELLLKNYISWKYNYTWTFTVKVTDGENEPKKSYVYVTVTYIAPEPEIPTKEKKRCILCTSTGKGVVAVLCVEAFLIFIAIIHCIFRMHACQTCHLKPKPRIQTLADMKKIIKEQQKADDPYLHGNDILLKALPKEKPPESFNYRYGTPVRRRIEPPEAAQYLPPGAIIDLQHVPEHNAHARRENVQVTAEVYPRNIKHRYERGDGLYHFTDHDQSAIIAETRPPIGPMFKTPDKSSLYNHEPISKPREDLLYDAVEEDGLDF